MNNKYTNIVELSANEVDTVFGGITFKEVAEVATMTCGQGNVAEVYVKDGGGGFKCK